MCFKLLYADVDGVLNGHERHPNGFSGMRLDCVGHLNQLLAEMPDVQLVLSSAWRYQVLNGNMNLAGVECWMQTLGLDCHQRIHSVTASDEQAAQGWYEGKMEGQEWWDWLKENGAELRSHQIRDHFTKHMANVQAFAVVDDLSLPCPRFVQTVATEGLTAERAALLKQLLGRQVDIGELRYCGWWQ